VCLLVFFDHNCCWLVSLRIASSAMGAQIWVMVEMSLDMTLFDLAPFGLVSAGGRRPLQRSLLCLYFSQVRVAAREKVPLTSMLPTSTASLPHAGSKTLRLQSCSLSRALLSSGCCIGV